MTMYQPFPAPQAPIVAAPRSHTADIVVTSILMALHVGVFMLAAFFSLFFAMAGDSCGSSTQCNTGNIGGAYLLTDLVGFLILLAASTFAIVLLTRHKLAFWVPLMGVLTQVVLVAVSITLLDNVAY